MPTTRLVSLSTASLYIYVEPSCSFDKLASKSYKVGPPAQKKDNKIRKMATARPALAPPFTPPTYTVLASAWTMVSLEQALAFSWLLWIGGGVVMHLLLGLKSILPSILHDTVTYGKLRLGQKDHFPIFSVPKR